MANAKLSQVRSLIRLGRKAGAPSCGRSRLLSEVHALRATKHTLELMAPASTHHNYPGV